MYFHFGNALVFTMLALFLAAFHLALGSLLRPANPEARKLTTYECGEPPTGSAWINFNIRFYLIALVFVVFEVEVAVRGEALAQASGASKKEAEQEAARLALEKLKS